MEYPEVPTENLHEEIHHHAEHSGERWVLGVALTSAILASLAAVTSLQAGHLANEAMIAQIESSDQWSFFQSKSIKESQLGSKIGILDALGKPAADADKAKMREYEDDKKKIQEKAEELQKEAKENLHRHESLARSVTMFQVAIAVGAISVLTKRRAFWFLSLLFGAGGLFCALQGWVPGIFGR